METIEELKCQLSDSQARECAMREALAEARDTMSSECSDGCTCGDGWEHDDPKLIARIDAALTGSTSPCPHERQVKELESENATLRTANNMAQDLLNQAMDGLKTERERFEWLCSHHGRVPDEWRAEIDKARKEDHGKKY